jgi:hypothetical protein
MSDWFSACLEGAAGVGGGGAGLVTTAGVGSSSDSLSSELDSVSELDSSSSLVVFSTVGGVLTVVLAPSRGRD